MSKSKIKKTQFTPSEQRKNLVKMLRRIYDVFVVKEAPKSGNDYGCRYDRSITRYGCAIGCCIHPKTATKWDDCVSSDATSVVGLTQYGINVCGTLGLNNNARNVNMLNTLQESHDDSDNNVELKNDVLKAIRRVAHNRRIRMSEITQ